MAVIAKRTLAPYAQRHSDAAEVLNHWYAVASHARWDSLVDVRKAFSDADQVGPFLVFNIRRNTYRLIVKVDYRSKLLLVKAFLTHKEYERGAWKK